MGKCVWTFAGSILSLFLSTKLLVLFSGKGIVQASILNNPSFLKAVALGAAMLCRSVRTFAGNPILKLAEPRVIAKAVPYWLNPEKNKVYIPLLERLLQPFKNFFRLS